MPGRANTPPEEKARKLAAYTARKVARASARARDAPGVAAALHDACLRVIRAVQAGSNVGVASAAHGMHAAVFWDALSCAPDLIAEYQKALLNRASVYGEQPVGLSDESLLDPAAFYTDKNGVKRIDPAYVQLQKLRVNARQWDAERLRPDLYAPPSTASQRGPTTINVTVQRFVVGKDQRASIDANADDDATAAIDAHAAKQSERE
jgi:hypothetical protein